jgi:hypothetical protein
MTGAACADALSRRPGLCLVTERTSRPSPSITRIVKARRGQSISTISSIAADSVPGVGDEFADDARRAVEELDAIMHSRFEIPL